MSIQIQTNTWSDFKSLFLSKSLLVQYSDSSYAYDVYAVDGQIVYSYSIIKSLPAGTDQTDFENNYKTAANQILDITRVLLTQEVSQLSQLISNTAGETGAIPLESQQVVQLSDLNIAVVTEIAQLTTTLLYESQQVAQLSQIIVNTAVSGIDTRSYLAQEITQLSTLQLYGSQEVGQLSTIITLTEDASSAPLTTLLTQEVAQLSEIITNTSVSGIDIRPLLLQEVAQLSNLNVAVALEVTQLTTVNATLVQEVAQLSTLNASNDSQVALLTQEVTQLTTLQLYGSQEVAQLSTLNLNVATAASQTAQITLLAQEVGQLSSIVTNTSVSGIDIRPLLSQEVTQLSNLNLAVALEVTQLSTVNVTLAQEAAQLTTLNTSNTSQVTLLAQEVVQLSQIISNTATSGIDIRPLLSQEVTQLSNLNLAVALEVSQLTTVNTTLAQEVAQLSTLNTSNSGQVTLLAQEVAQLSTLMSNSSEGTVAAGTAGTKSILTGGVYRTTPPTLTNGQQAAFQLDANGNLQTKNVSALLGATPVLKAGGLVTTAVTTDQVVLTYTVTAGKTFWIEYLTINGWRTTLPGNTNPLFLGEMSLEFPSGTKNITLAMFHAPLPAQFASFSDPFPIAAGVVVRVVVTPSTATSTTWRANFGGYEV